MRNVITRTVVIGSLLNAGAAAVFFYTRSAETAPPAMLLALLLSGTASSFLVLGFFSLLLLRLQPLRAGAARTALAGCLLGILALWLAYALGTRLMG